MLSVSFQNTFAKEVGSPHQKHYDERFIFPAIKMSVTKIKMLLILLDLLLYKYKYQ